jgi:hypothetical protein
MRDVFEANESRMMLLCKYREAAEVVGAAEKASTALHSLMTNKENDI